MTIRDVAKHADVSIATVSHVLNNTRAVRPATRNRVEAAIGETGYHRNTIARELKTGSSEMIGVIIIAYDAFFTEVLRGIDEAVSPLGWESVVSCAGEDWERQKNLIHMMISRRMQGILVAPAEGFDADYVQSILPSGVPFVLFDRKPLHARLPSVVMSDYQAARSVADHMAMHGYKSVGIILGENQISTLVNRKRGFLERSAELKLNVYLEEASSDEIGGYIAASKLFSGAQETVKLDAIFAANNLTLIGLLRYLRDHDIQLGVDVAVIGFGHGSWCDVVTPQLTVVREPARDIGFESVQLMQRMIECPSDTEICLDTELLIGGSCGCNLNRF